MKRLDRLFLRLYPSTWRARYGDELEALIEDSGSSFTTKMNLLAGAIRMQFSLPSFPKLAIALAVGGTLAGLGISFVVTPQYVSTATMQLRGAPNLKEHLSQLQKNILSRTSLSPIIQDPRLNLYAQERLHTPLEDVIQRMRTRDILIRLLPSSGDKYVSFSVSFIYRDRAKARQTIQALMTKFMDANLTHQSVSANLGVVDPPNMPIAPIFPNRAAFTATGGAGGLACAILIALFRRKPAPIPYPAQTA